MLLAPDRGEASDTLEAIARNESPLAAASSGGSVSARTWSELWPTWPARAEHSDAAAAGLRGEAEEARARAACEAVGGGAGAAAAIAIAGEKAGRRRAGGEGKRGLAWAPRVSQRLRTEKGGVLLTPLPLCLPACLRISVLR